MSFWKHHLHNSNVQLFQKRAISRPAIFAIFPYIFFTPEICFSIFSWRLFRWSIMSGLSGANSTGPASFPVHFTIQSRNFSTVNIWNIIFKCGIIRPTRSSFALKRRYIRKIFGSFYLSRTYFACFATIECKGHVFRVFCKIEGLRIQNRPRRVDSCEFQFCIEFIC